MTQPVVNDLELAARFREIAEDQEREQEAIEWSESTMDGIEAEVGDQLPNDVTRRLNEVYGQADSHMDEAIMALYQVSLPNEEW